MWTAMEADQDWQKSFHQEHYFLEDDGDTWCSWGNDLELQILFPAKVSFKH